MNDLDQISVDHKSFAWRDLQSQDRWDAFTPSFTLTVVGTPTYTGRFRLVGRECQFQVSMVSTTSIASTAGTSYLTLPITAKGIGGMAILSDDTTNIAVGVCHIDVATSRCYTPALAASGDTFTLSGRYEV